MWLRQERNSLGRHERIPTPPNPTEISHASTPDPSQEEVTSTNSGQSISPSLQPLEREQTAAVSSSSDQTSGTIEDDAAGASDPSTENRVTVGESTNEGEDEEDTETRLELVELARSRSLRRRRLFVCILILSLLLLRLYIEAILHSDFALFWACLILTSWLMRWINSQREAEELMDERMENLWREDTRRSDEDDVEAMTHDRRRQRRRRRSRQRAGAADGEQELNFRMLSFQAQLSMAIMESQRHILVNGGFGRPDGDDPEENRGVTDEAKRRWDRFEFGEGEPATNKLKTEDKSCCICLAEYEPGDDLYVVPCGHVYHIDCINSWCTSHVRCPLCNFDLEEGCNDAADGECATGANSRDETASSGGLEALA